MALIPKLKFFAPKRSNVNLSHIVRFTAAPGNLDPILTEDILPGDKVKLDIVEDVLTTPTLAPILGSFTVETTVFFTPWRNWYRKLHEDNIFGEASDLPAMNFHNFEMDNYEGVKDNSLLAFLGLPAGFRVNNALTNEPVRMYFNAHGIISYFDIFRTYFMDPQVRFCYQWSSGNLNAINCGYIQSWYDQVVNSEIAQTVDKIAAVPEGTSLTDLYPARFTSTNFAGKFVRAYAPDVVSLWLEKSDVDSTRSATMVEIDHDTFSIDSLNLAHKVKMFFDRITVSGKRYSGFVGALFGQTIRRDLNIPQLLGRFSQELTFKNVVNTTAPSAADQAEPLGALAGYGHSVKSSNRTIRFTAREFGTLQVIHCIIPHPDYYQRVDPQLTRKSFSDCYNPLFDKLGFEPRRVAFRGYDYSQTIDFSTPDKNPFSQTYGYLPAWSDYKFRVNRLVGKMATELRYWTLAQDVTRQNNGSVYDTTQNMQNSYILPYLFNYAFADASTTAENFICQVAFGLRMKRPISKNQLPSIR